MLQEINSMLMERQAKLQELNHLKSDFMAIVSHELRPPLASIIGYVDLMLDEETGPLSRQQSQCLSIIEHNAERLSRLINDILDLSHIEAGRIDLAMVPLDVVEIAKETVITIKPQAQVKGIEMTVSMAEGLPLIQGDTDRIRQVLVNALGNAIKFTPQGGRVEISGWCLAAGEQPPSPGPELATTSDWLLVSVTDTGVGIAAEELDRIFDKFYQMDYLTKPIDRQRLSKSVRRLTRTESCKGIFPSVLIVDDDKELVDLLRIYLLGEGFWAICAYNGQESLEKVKEQLPDLIILDILMPEMDGFEVIETLQSSCSPHPGHHPDSQRFN